MDKLNHSTEREHKSPERQDSGFDPNQRVEIDDTQTNSMEQENANHESNEKNQEKEFDPNERVEVDTDDQAESEDEIKENSDFQDKPKESTPLSEDDKKALKEETGWSDKVVDAISSKEESDIYRQANLKEAIIDDKICLIRSDIDMNAKDPFGRTNEQRMEKGLSPVSKEGSPIELHHIGQKNDGPLAELTKGEHQSSDNTKILHDSSKSSEIERGKFDTIRKNHWKDRVGEEVKDEIKNSQ